MGILAQTKPEPGARLPLNLFRLCISIAFHCLPYRIYALLDYLMVSSAIHDASLPRIELSKIQQVYDMIKFCNNSSHLIQCMRPILCGMLVCRKLSLAGCLCMAQSLVSANTEFQLSENLRVTQITD